MMRGMRGHVGGLRLLFATICLSLSRSLLGSLLAPADRSSLLAFAEVFVNANNSFVVLRQSVVYALSERLSLHFSETSVIHLCNPLHQIGLMYTARKRVD